MVFVFLEERRIYCCPSAKNSLLVVDFLVLSHRIWKCQQVPKMCHTEESKNPSKATGTRCIGSKGPSGHICIDVVAASVQYTVLHKPLLFYSSCPHHHSCKSKVTRTLRQPHAGPGHHLGTEPVFPRTSELLWWPALSINTNCRQIAHTAKHPAPLSCRLSSWPPGIGCLLNLSFLIYKMAVGVWGEWHHRAFFQVGGKGFSKAPAGRNYGMVCPKSRWGDDPHFPAASRGYRYGPW